MRQIAKWGVALTLTGALLAPLAPVQAQGPGGGGGMSRMRNSPKRRLSGLVRNIGDLEKAKKAPLTKAQAKQMVAAIMPWTKKPRMSDTEAKALYMRLNGVLTTKQKNEMDKMAAQNRRFGGGGDRGGQGGGPGRGGQGGGGGRGMGDMTPAQMQQMRAKMEAYAKTSNPFYSPAASPEVRAMPERMRQGMMRRYTSQKAILTALMMKAK